LKICVAQAKPAKGDVQSNIDGHKRLIDLAASAGADTIVFPELSITGYEPELSNDLATDQEDDRLDVFQRVADEKQVSIGVGLPTKNGGGVCISTVIFQPRGSRRTYSKRYLHPDEEKFFVAGQRFDGWISSRANVALAICYELSIPEHSESAHKSGAEIYVASVAKTKEGVERAVKSLSEIASRYSMPALMSNCVGLCGGAECAGRSSVWDSRGALVAQLNGSDEGIIIFDTETKEVIEKTVKNSS
jgi:predicted amidohydrolase